MDGSEDKVDRTEKGSNQRQSEGKIETGEAKQVVD